MEKPEYRFAGLDTAPPRRAPVISDWDSIFQPKPGDERKDVVPGLCPEDLVSFVRAWDAMSSQVRKIVEDLLNAAPDDFCWDRDALEAIHEVVWSEASRQAMKRLDFKV